jgi:hypothetical protein
LPAAVAVGLTTATPDVYYDMHGNHGVTRLIVATDSATTPNVTPDVYYDM